MYEQVTADNIDVTVSRIRSALLEKVVTACSFSAETGITLSRLKVRVSGVRKDVFTADPGTPDEIRLSAIVVEFANAGSVYFCFDPNKHDVDDLAVDIGVLEVQFRLREAGLTPKYSFVLYQAM